MSAHVQQKAFKAGRKKMAISRAHRSPVTLADIRLRAFKLWEAAGKPDGDGARFWLEAAHELQHTDAELETRFPR